MVWWGVPSGGYTYSYLQERGGTGVRVYQGDMLQIVKPLNTTLFNGQKWVFQHDSAPAHKGKTTQEGLQRNLLAFTSAETWPSGSADLNHLDCKLWAVLEDMAFRNRHNSLDSLRRFIVKTEAEILLETVRAAIAEWPEHLKACVEAEGSHFE